MGKSRFNIVMIDRKEKFSTIFTGLRKHKFSINYFKNTSGITDTHFEIVNMFFVVLYEYKDVFELLKLNNCNCPIIIGSDNLNILKKIRKIDKVSVVDMSEELNLKMGLYSCIQQFYS